MGHAYIFEGENKLEVRERARAFAMGLNCERGDACGVCKSCRVFESGNHPDTIYVYGTKKSGIGVEDVRAQIINPAAVKPFQYKYKIFITENADTLTDQAQNALLKTIEEPAPYGVFLFLAPNTFNFLPTVLSRCVVKKIRCGEDGAVSPEIQALAQEIITALRGADIPAAFSMYRKIEHLPREDMQEFLNAMYILCGKMRHLAATQEITKTKRVLSQNANTQLAMELLFLKMSEGLSPAN